MPSHRAGREYESNFGQDHTTASPPVSTSLRLHVKAPPAIPKRTKIGVSIQRKKSMQGVVSEEGHEQKTLDGAGSCSIRGSHSFRYPIADIPNGRNRVLTQDPDENISRRQKSGVAQYRHSPDLS